MPESTPKPNSQQAAKKGLILGLVSAVGYSTTNLALRALKPEQDDFAWEVWVTAMKAVPTVILALLLLTRRRFRGLPLYPTTKPILPLIIAALVMQFGGNLGFQLALGRIGLAITVPIVFSFIIFAGAILGRIFLGDKVTRRTVAAFVVMVLSIIFLSIAAADSAQAATGSIVVFGVIMAVVSGTSYGINGAVIRGIARDHLPVESMLLIYSTTGLLLLTAMGGWLMGDRVLNISGRDWGLMLIAGIFNAGAFYCVTNALKLMNISRVNVVNATQNAMCAIGAVLLFGEPASALMISGITLSICGLLVLDRK